jgi:hypothetical protein
VAGL